MSKPKLSEYRRQAAAFSAKYNLNKEATAEIYGILHQAWSDGVNHVTKKKQIKPIKQSTTTIVKTAKELYQRETGDIVKTSNTGGTVYAYYAWKNRY